jgi:hypothetical protein
MPVPSNGLNHADNEEELVNLDLDSPPQSNGLLQPESLLDKLIRCGGDRDGTPLPWPQLSVAMLISLSEGMSKPSS